uniref:Uncharacterized protein n=1 Tax=Arundo donax TaxID=35708 RepID=A0A0A8YJN1_ARUDO
MMENDISHLLSYGTTLLINMHRGSWRMIHCGKGSFKLGRHLNFGFVCCRVRCLHCRDVE